MQIQWFGQSFFKIQGKAIEDIIIAIDPFNDSYGLKVPKFQADILMISHDHNDHNNTKAIMGNPFIINGPGEYETKGVIINGIPAYHDDKNGQERGQITMYKFNFENFNIAHLSDLGHQLNNEQISQLGTVDILMVPVGGQFTIDAKTAHKVITDIEPRIIIPMHYHLSGLKFKSGKNLDSLESFLKEAGYKSEVTDKLKIAAKDLPQEETKIIILKP